MRTIFFSLAFVLLACGSASANDRLISSEHAIAIANMKVIELGYDLTQMYPEIDENNHKWNEYLKGHLRTDLGPNQDPGPKVRQEFEQKDAKLRGKQFWDIAYKYKPKNGTITIGGVLVFVDANNGEMILIIEHPCSELCETRPSKGDGR